MYEYFEGKIIQVSPTHLVIETGGIGYLLLISLNSFERLKDKQQARVWAHLVVKEDAHTLYGFSDQPEREMFRQLIQVNGIGSATARMMLSSLNPDELAEAIAGGNITLLKSIKGIGPKAAQRIVVELQDKISKMSLGSALISSGTSSSKVVEEALEAMVALGFARPTAQKVVSKVSQDLGRDATIEAIIKNSLKLL